MILVLQDLNTTVLLSLSFGQILAGLLAALLCGALVSLLYRYASRGPSYSSTFAQSLIFLSLITALVIMVIGSNLARAFGLVGAMSIIRFRTAIKDMQDIIFIFFALAVGLAAGAGAFSIAVTGTVLIGAVVLVLARSRFGQPRNKDFLLQLCLAPDAADDAPYLAVFERYCRGNKLVNARTQGGSGELELSFYVRLRDEDAGAAFVRDLRATAGVSRASVFFDEDPTI
jgi:uncharacterized membrane protein YhiD involved in acid resistance